MRKWIYLISFILFTHCAPAEEAANSDTNNPSGTQEIRLKTLSGEFNSININSITQLKVSVADSSGVTAIVKTYTFPESAKRTQDLGLDKPNQKKSGTLKKTGTVDLQYISEGTSLEFTRRFDVFNHQYLQDITFQDVYYTTGEKITFDWLEDQ